MTRPYLTVYGHVALDHIISLERFPPVNTSVDVLDKETFFGGTAANLATIAASLGVPTALASYVGEDLPAEFEDFMLRRGVLLGDMVKLKGKQTPVVWVVSDASHNQIAYVFQGAMRDMDLYELRTGMASLSSRVHIGTGRPGYYRRLMEALSGEGRRVSFDPAQEIHHIWSIGDFAKALSMSEVLFANEGELETAMRYMGKEHPDELLDHVSAVVNTRGANGTLIYIEGERLEVPAIEPRRLVDTTGAGDAFRAGFYAGSYRGYDVRDSAVMGSAAASFVVESRGGMTNIPEWGEVLDRADQFLDR